MDRFNGHYLPLIETFKSLQGEGFHTGKAAFFVRLAGCDVACHFCDTPEGLNAELYPFVPIEKIVEESLKAGLKDIIITGGEPLQWNLQPLTALLHQHNFTIYLETSGTEPLTGKFDWICCSPKRKHPIHPEFYQLAHEIKIIVVDQDDLRFALEIQDQFHSDCLLFLQPEWSKKQIVIPQIVSFILTNPRWRLSLQIHKYINIL
ncbi:MAG: 7-carboxy-7-deazaguanine synthase QueE [Bacteroidales bacterium]|nr:7-carboxy-7-deazaguanine synthase QueE [Bacteroidales bacterium]